MKNLYLFPMYLIAKGLLRRKMIYWGQGRDLLDKNAKIKNLAYAAEQALCDAIILYAEHLKKYVPERFHKKVFIANNTLYRDIRSDLMVDTQLWFFVTPVAYPLPQTFPYSFISTVNPVSPIFTGARDLISKGGGHGYGPVSGCLFSRHHGLIRRLGDLSQSPSHNYRTDERMTKEASVIEI